MKPDHPVILNLAAARATVGRGMGKNGTNRLQEIAAFGSNPGALRGWYHAPAALPGGAPLVVVLHGCTQNAADYDRSAGWSQLASELGFAVLLPEQTRANNANLCFNWFSPIDSRRDSGEALSIRQMIAWMADAHDIDAQRVFVTGLSAGGAMTSIMLATYPEVFAGGAIIAGLPYGAATSVGDAFARMAGQGYPDQSRLGALIREASPHAGPWPRISVWHGDADSTVAPANADRIIGQWRSLHGVDAASAEERHCGTHITRSWRNDTSQAVLEQHVISGMGHGTPLKTHGADGCGTPGPYMLEVGVSSTRDIARFWGLAEQVEGKRIATTTTTTTARAAPAIPTVATRAARLLPIRKPQKGIGAVIEDALRAAGLMK